jgi:hypothetical protein
MQDASGHRLALAIHTTSILVVFVMLAFRCDAPTAQAGGKSPHVISPKTVRDRQFADHQV